MVKKVIKRDGKIENFDLVKIIDAVYNALNDGMEEFKNEENFYETLKSALAERDSETMPVEAIHDEVIRCLKLVGENKIAENYSYFRTERDKVRDNKSKIMKTIHALAEETDRDNGNVGNNFSAKLLRIASESNKWAVLARMDKTMAKHHEVGDYHTHDLDSFNLTVNCLHVPTGQLLREGFNTGYGTLRTPQRIESAAMLTCIMLQSSQNK